MDGITSLQPAADDRPLGQWIEDQIYEARARQDSTGSCISSMAEIRAYKAVLRRIEGENK